MRKCGKCQAFVTSTDTFCGVCGASLPKEAGPAPRQCPKCSGLVLQGDIFCGTCGAAIPQEPVKRQILCPKCQSPVPINDAFCGVCGTRVQTEPPVRVPPVFPQEIKPQQRIQPPPPPPPPAPPSKPVAVTPVAKPPSRAIPQTSFSYVDKPKSSKGAKTAVFIILGGAAVIVLMIGIAAAVFFGLKWFEKKAEPKVETPVGIAAKDVPFVSIPSELQKYITSQGKKAGCQECPYLEDGSVFLVKGDYDSDGKEDVAVWYSFAGPGTQWSQWLAISASSLSGKILSCNVGGSLDRSVNTMRSANSKVILDVLVNGPNDGNTGGSIPKTFSYFIQNGKLYKQ